MPHYTTSAAFVSGAICGHMWMPEQLGSVLLQKDLRGPWGIMDRIEQPSFRDALLSLLSEDGGDFQDAAFTADTVVRVERRTTMGQDGRYSVHVFERSIAELKDCADLASDDHYTADFLSE